MDEGLIVDQASPNRILHSVNTRTREFLKEHLSDGTAHPAA
jgi:hypothetical protein